jgi:hypothetical protein
MKTNKNKKQLKKQTNYQKSGMEWFWDEADPLLLLQHGSGICPSKVFSLFLLYI